MDKKKTPSFQFSKEREATMTLPKASQMQKGKRLSTLHSIDVKMKTESIFYTPDINK